MQARSRIAVVLTLVAIAGRGSDAVAGDPEPSSSAGWQQRQRQYAAQGLGQDRGTPRAAPVEVRSEVPTAQSSVGRAVVFVNFDGATLQYQANKDDARTNTTFMSEFTGSYAQFAPYGDGAKRDAVLQAVQADWADYDVEVTDARPGAGQYVMNMTGPTNPFGGSTLGIAPLDCNDNWTHNNITYAFHSIGDGFSASETATTVSQEVAHSFGLEHVDDPSDIMNPFNAGGDASFRDECISIIPAPQIGILCGSQHEAECGEPDEQNAHAEILTLFGEPGPDQAPPSVSIVEPSDGAHFDPGVDFTVAAEADDDRGLTLVRLRLGDQVLASRTSPPFSWTVQDAPIGTYVFTVDAEDAAGNLTASQSVTVTVGEASQDDGPDEDPGTDEHGMPEPDPDGGDDDSSPGNGTGMPEDDQDGDEDTGAVEPTDESGESSDGLDENASGGEPQNSALLGRGCAIDPGRSPGALLVLLVLPWLRRRSR